MRWVFSSFRICHPSKPRWRKTNPALLVSLSSILRLNPADSPEQAEWERQLQLLVEQHRSFPSIYTWVIYNEGWGQLASAPESYLTPRVRTMDPTRLIDAVSGWNDHGAGDFSDNHHVCLITPLSSMALTASTRTHNVERQSTLLPRVRTIRAGSVSRVNLAVLDITSRSSSMFPSPDQIPLWLT
jgi:hypothetical protein